jgi:lipopolysaccharide export system protein LptA
MMGSGQEMVTWDRNRKIRYTTNAVVWQGSMRVQGNDVFIDREVQKLEARGDVVTRVPDERQPDSAAADKPPAEKKDAAAAKAPDKDAKKVQDSNTARKFSVTTAKVFTYDGKTKQGLYQEDVHLVRTDVDMRSKYMRTFFEDAPKQGGGTETKLEHLQADGAVDIVQRPKGHVRHGTGEHAEFYLADERMLLTGDPAQVTDPERGTTKGPKITWLSRYDKLVVEGEKKSDRVQSRSMKEKPK